MPVVLDAEARAAVTRAAMTARRRMRSISADVLPDEDLALLVRAAIADRLTEVLPAECLEKLAVLALFDIADARFGGQVPEHN